MSETPIPGEPKQCLGANEQVEPVRYRLPPDATDCHCHVFENFQRFPLVPERSYTPALATVPQYLAMCAAVGISRTVQVSASVYGRDNSLTLDAIARLGLDRARGVAGVSPDVTDKELERLHAGGIRGVRLSTHVKGYGGFEVAAALAPKLKARGWHLQLHAQHVAELVELEPLLMGLQVPIVFDHLGSVRGGEGVDHPGFKVLLRVLRAKDDAWTKISSWYRRSDANRGDCPDMRPIAEKLVETRVDRLLFGTNWPHPNLFSPDTVPDDGVLVNTFCDWIGDNTMLEKIFTLNPERLYGFGTGEATM